MNTPTRLTALLLALSLSVGVGCADQREAEANKALETALGLLDQANAGFVPDDQPRGTTYQQYRLGQIAKAVEPLNTAVASADPAIQAAAAELLADVHETQARAAAKRATDRAADLASRGSTAVSLLLAADSARNRAQVFDTDPSEAVSLLQKEGEQFASQAQQIESDLKKLRAQSQQLAQQQAQLAEQRKALLDKARSTRNDAFTQNGSDAVDQYTAAAKLEQQASNLQAQRQTLESQQQAIDARIETHAKQLKAIEEARGQLARGVTETRELAGERDKLSRAALQERDQRVAELTKELDEIAAEFTQDVQPLFTQARDYASSAVQALEAATPRAPAALRDDLKLRLVGAMTQQLDIMAAEYQALAGYADTFRLAADNAPRVAPDRAAAISEAFAKLRDIRDQLQSEAAAIITEARALAGELAQGDGDIAQLAAERESDIDRYARSLNPA